MEPLVVGPWAGYCRGKSGVLLTSGRGASEFTSGWWRAGGDGL